MNIPEVTSAKGEGVRDLAIQTLVLGFAADPLFRWAWPTAKAYQEAMPRFAEAFGGKAFLHDTAYQTDDGHAYAMWLPPGEEVDADQVVGVLSDTLPAEKQEDVFGVLEQMGSYHPHEACWYLSIIAADPAWMGRGLGAALMKHALRVVDEAGLPAYLESSNPKNISLYERHGFEVMGEIKVGNCPTVRPMYRQPA